jgi:hypothetical protein
MLRDRHITQFGDVGIKYLALSVLNDGTKDSNLVKAKAILTARKFKEQKALKELQLGHIIDSDDKKRKAISVKAGEEFEVFIPIEDLRLNSCIPFKGWITVVLLSAYGQYYFTLSYTIHERNLQVKKTNPIIQFPVETIVFSKYRRGKSNDEMLEI